MSGVTNRTHLRPLTYSPLTYSPLTYSLFNNRRGKPLLADRLHQFLRGQLGRIIMNKEPVIFQIRLNRLDPRKTFQGLLDLVRSVESVKPQTADHALNMQRDRFSAVRCRGLLA